MKRTDSIHESTVVTAREHQTPDRELGVEVYGYDAGLNMVHAYGVAAGVSSSEMLAHLDADLPIGTRTVVALRSPSARVEPTILRGKVARSEKTARGFGLAIHFDLDVDLFACEAA